MSWLVWGGVVVVIVAATQMEDDPVLGVRVLAAFAVIAGAALLIQGLRRALLPRQGDGSTPPVVVSRTDLLVGETFTVRARSPRERDALRVRLVFSERVQGRASGGARQRAADQRDVVVRTAGGQADQTLELWIPEDGMHSFSSKHAELAWRLDVDVVRHGKTESGSLPLTVRPGTA